MEMIFTDKPRKFVRGPFPCNYCDGGHHPSCRPRNDGWPCTCACPSAAEIRAEVDCEIMSAELKGEKITGEQALSRIRAKKKNSDG